MLQTKESRGTSPAIVIILLPMLLLLLIILVSLKSQVTLMFKNSMLQSFTTIFLSIILEAIPFIIIGVFISSLIQEFISEETIARIIPKNKIVGIFIAGIVGIVFPVCDCAIIPIVRRLLKKGMPLYIGVTFMLSVPIINPVVLVSTYYAFLNSPHMVLMRGGIGAISAMTIGFIVSKFKTEEDAKTRTRTKTVRKVAGQWIYTLNQSNNKLQSHIYSHSHLTEEHHHHDDDHCSCGHDHHHEKNATITGTIVEILEHTSAELKDVGKFVIAGAFLSSVMQVVLPRKYMLTIGHNRVTSILVMIALAFLLSVCSETDAFIARTFVGQFTNGSIIAFLIFGPMIDIKNTLMLSQTFKAKFIIKLISLIFMVCFTIGIVVNFIGVQL
ncbi:permease [Clostridium akagii]|uniref:permease n=1 Tax=Clostridium akagii TaxID=91623 RepID=UPI00047B9FB7|nr:permease [Clostridium akagii]